MRRQRERVQVRVGRPVRVGLDLADGLVRPGTRGRRCGFVAGRRHVRSLPERAVPRLQSTVDRPIGGRDPIDSPHVPRAPDRRLPSGDGPQRGHPPCRAGLGRVGVRGVGALRRARRVRLRARRVDRSRDRRPRAPAAGGRDRAARLLPRGPLPARALPARRSRSSGRRRSASRPWEPRSTIASSCSPPRRRSASARRSSGRRSIALLPSLARTANELIAANGATSTLESLGTLIGPLAAGLLVAFADLGVVFAASAAALLVSAALLVRVSVPGRVEEPASTTDVGVWEGFRAIGEAPERAPPGRSDRIADLRPRVPERADRRHGLPGAARRRHGGRVPDGRDRRRRGRRCARRDVAAKRAARAPVRLGPRLLGRPDHV